MREGKFKVEVGAVTKCPECHQSVLLREDGSMVPHNIPGWTVGSASRRASRPLKCIGRIGK